MVEALNDALGHIHDDVRLLSQNDTAEQGMSKLLTELNSDKALFNQNWSQITDRTAQEIQAAHLPQFDLSNDSISNLDVTHDSLQFATTSGKSYQLDSRGQAAQGKTEVNPDTSVKTTWSNGRTEVDYPNSGVYHSKVVTEADGSKKIITHDAVASVNAEGKVTKYSYNNGGFGYFSNEGGKWVYREKNGDLSDELTVPTSIDAGSDNSITIAHDGGADSDLVSPYGFSMHKGEGGQLIDEVDGRSFSGDKVGTLNRFDMKEGDYFLKEGDKWTHYTKGRVADGKTAPQSVTTDDDGVVTVKYADSATDTYRRNGDIEHVSAQGKHTLEHVNGKTDILGADGQTVIGQVEQPHVSHKHWSDDRQAAKKQSLNDIKSGDKHTVQRGDTLWDMSANSLKAHGNDQPSIKQINDEMARVESKKENKGKFGDRENIAIGTELDFSDDNGKSN